MIMPSLRPAKGKIQWVEIKICRICKLYLICTIWYIYANKYLTFQEVCQTRTTPYQWSRMPGQGSGFFQAICLRWKYNSSLRRIWHLLGYTRPLFVRCNPAEFNLRREITELVSDTNGVLIRGLIRLSTNAWLSDSDSPKKIHRSRWRLILH